MTSGVYFYKKKAELINCYKEYVELLENLQLSDIHNFEELDKLSKAHEIVVAKSRIFTEFMNTYRQSPENENQAGF